LILFFDIVSEDVINEGKGDWPEEDIFESYYIKIVSMKKIFSLIIGKITNQRLFWNQDNEY
jgi:hypothetical protein